MNVELKDGKLYVEGLSKNELFKLYNKLRVDLLDSRIIHYRPIAFSIESNKVNAVQSNVEKIPGLGYSIAEIAFILSDVITNEQKGVMDGKLESSPSSKLRSDCSYISLYGRDIGTDVFGSMFYSGLGMNEKPNMLINDLKLFSNLKDDLRINLVLMRGSGVRDFNDNWDMVYTTNYIPIRTYYNLYDVVTVRSFNDETDDCIILHYNNNVNEEVLNSILSEYINSEEVKNCLK